ncbi:uncharacterized protein ACRADG_012770 [Cochliomyia hominivorax]
MNMTLVEIDASSKSQELSSLIKHVRDTNNLKNATFWIGGIMTQYPSKHFVWLSTGKKFTYTNWYANNPNFVGRNEFCVQIVMEKNFGWNDNRCLNNFGFICELNKIQQIEEKQKQWQQEIQSVKETLLQESHSQQQKHQILEQDLEMKIEKIQQELDKETKLQEKLKTEKSKNMEMQKEVEKLLESQQDLQLKLQQLKDNKLKKQEKYEHNIQKELQEQETLRQELEIQKELNEQLQEQLQELKNSLSNLPNEYEENIKKELKEQERLRKELKTPGELIQQFQEQLKEMMKKKQQI